MQTAKNLNMYQKSPRKEIIFMEMSFKKPIKKVFGSLQNVLEYY